MCSFYCYPNKGEPGRGGGGLPGPGGGVCLVRGGLPSPGGCLPGPGGGVGVLASQHALRQTPSPPVDRQTPVKTLPWPQLRCGRVTIRLRFDGYYGKEGDLRTISLSLLHNTDVSDCVTRSSTR